MKHTIDASINFSYKGEGYDLTTTVNLNNLAEAEKALANIHFTLAKKNNIDTYSYLYEVMESYSATFSNPVGVAGKCFDNGQFDMAAFKQLQENLQQLETAAAIAKEHLDIDDLALEPKIKSALLAALKARDNSE